MEEHLKAGGEKLFDYRIQRTFTIGESKCKNNEESVKYAINVIVYNYITCITTCIRPKFFFLYFASDASLHQVKCCCTDSFYCNIEREHSTQL